MKKSHFLLLFAFALLAVVACNKSKKIQVSCDGSSPTYNSFVKDVVNSNCISCHSGYSTFAGLSTITTNGRFEKYVLVDQTMPESGSLSQDVMNKLQCWVNNGFPEN